MARGIHNVVACHADDIGSTLLFRDFVRKKYLPFIQENKRSWKTDERYLTQHILPYLGACPLEDFSRETFLNWLNKLELSGLSESSRYRMFWLVKYVLNCAVRWGDLASNAAFREVVFQKNIPQRRPAILSLQELLSLIRLLNEYASRPSAQAIHLLLLTGASKSEILYARWEDVHLQRAVLSTNMTYTGIPRLIPLNTAAIQLIRSLPRKKDVPWLFTSSSGRRLTSIFYTWNLLRNRLGRPQLRLQDLRHNFAGLLVSIGLQQKELKAIMGHYMTGNLDQLQSQKGMINL